MFCTFPLALSVVCVQCPTWLFFCSSLILCFPGMLLRQCLSDFEMVPVTPVITGITLLLLLLLLSLLLLFVVVSSSLISTSIYKQIHNDFYTYIYATEIHHICGWGHHCLQGLLHSTHVWQKVLVYWTLHKLTKTMDGETKTDISLQPLKPDKMLKIS